jgi:hypothetical protein
MVEYPPLRSQKHISKIGSKMIKASFYLNFYLRNKVFDINDIHVNRDNYAYFYFKLKDVFLEKRGILSLPIHSCEVLSLRMTRAICA